MKKMVLFFLLVLSALSLPVQAEEWDAGLKDSIAGLDTVQASNPPKPEFDTLMDQDVASVRQSVAEVERRMSDLERSQRFIEDRVQLLQRNVDDLKRRR